MEEKLPISVILPIKSSKPKDFDDYFDKSIKSIQNQQVGIEELLIVHSSEESLVSFLNQYDFKDHVCVFQTIDILEGFSLERVVPIGQSLP